MLEGEGDPLWYPLKYVTIMANCTKTIFKTENQEPLAHWSQLRQINTKVRVTFFCFIKQACNGEPNEGTPPKPKTRDRHCTQTS
jgi:hypothetical protein